MIDPIKAKIIELCPDVMGKPRKRGQIGLLPENFDKDITLAVVLRAVQSLGNDNLNRHWVINRYGEFLKDRDDIPAADVGPRWNLEHDNYDQQSEETRAFIGQLLKDAGFPRT